MSTRQNPPRVAVPAPAGSHPRLDRPGHLDRLGRIAGSRTPTTVQALVLAFVLTLVPAVGQASAQPVVADKDSASPTLQALFHEGDQTDARLGAVALSLPGRATPPPTGLASELTKTAASTTSPRLLIAAWDGFPTADDWPAWQAAGLRYLDYLGGRHWLVELTADASTLFSTTGATTFAAVQPSDKVTPGLDQPAAAASFYDAAAGVVVVDVSVLPGLSAAARASLIDAYHVPGSDYVDQSHEHGVTLVTSPSSIAGLAARADVLRIDPGAWEEEVLMDGVRAAVQGDTVIGRDGLVLTGKRIRAATKERLYTGAAHEGFWHHDAAGFPTVPRWTEVAEQHCVHGISSTAWHGMMSAGILLGNGWFSDRYTDDPTTFRGLAPEAILECYSVAGAHAHVSSHSYVGSNIGWDRAIVGQLSEQRFHAHTVAGGNAGDDHGYYSMQNPSKNAMVVGNAQVDGPINWTSSAGPTNDGRMKPDLSAPTSNWRGLVTPGYSLEVAKIEIYRGPFKVVSWVFNSNGPAWHFGWGEPAGGFGKVYLDIGRQAGGKMRIDVEPGPWGEAWRNSPLLGTATLPSDNPLQPGAPLAIQGHEDDVLVIEYRALPVGTVDLGYFDLSPIWMRCYPQGSTDCDGLRFWNSQSGFGGIGIGDGQWRTLELPVGQASGIFMGGNPDWDDEETWAGESIEWLGLRFRRIDAQPTPSFPQGYNRASGGTSGASPVVGGAYALAMQHLDDLYPAVDLDRRDTPSPYASVSIGSELVQGMPFNSTWKAFFIHTADDMIRLHAHPSVPPNPDTGIPNVYHAGPDYTTGYGLIDVQAGIDLMTAIAADEPAHLAVEETLSAGQFHSYPVSLADFQVATGGLAATLVWDDEPASGGNLVNNLGLLLIDPTGAVHYPWSLDLPVPPVTADDIVPARRDQPNDRDNVEQVRVDQLDPSQAGTWTVLVVDHGMGGLASSQQYSLVVSPIDAIPSVGKAGI